MICHQIRGSWTSFFGGCKLCTRLQFRTALLALEKLSESTRLTFDLISYKIKAFGHGALATSITKSSLQVGAGTIWPQRGTVQTQEEQQTYFYAPFCFLFKTVESSQFTVEIVEIKLIKPGCQLYNWCQPSVISASGICPMENTVPCSFDSSAPSKRFASFASAASPSWRTWEVSVSAWFGRSLLFFLWNRARSPQSFPKWRKTSYPTSAMIGSARFLAVSKSIFGRK